MLIPLVSLFLLYFTLLCLFYGVCVLQLRNIELSKQLNKTKHDEMHLRSEIACLEHQNTRLIDQNDGLEAKISSMTKRTRDARGRFIPKERAAAVADAVKKLDALFASGLVKLGLKSSS